MNHKNQEEPLEKINKEIFYWREWFLKKQNIPDVVRVNFLSIPSCDFVRKSPEENLIESFVAYTQIRE